MANFSFLGTWNCTWKGLNGKVPRTGFVCGCILKYVCSAEKWKKLSDRNQWSESLWGTIFNQKREIVKPHKVGWVKPIL